MDKNLNSKSNENLTETEENISRANEVNETSETNSTRSADTSASADYGMYMDNQTVKRTSLGVTNSDSINLATGLLTLRHDDAATGGAILPVSVAHFYNPAAFKTSENPNKYSCGKCWKMSIQQYVEKTTALSVERFYYYDAMGKRHEFRYVSNVGTYEDTAGLGLTLTKVSNTLYRIEDKQHTTLEFTGDNGYLTKITDRNGNTVTYTYNGTRLVSATDSFGRSITFTYSDGYLSTITDPQNRVTSFTYDDNGRLVEITEPDNKKTTYTYETIRRMTNVVTSDGIKAVYTYLGETNKIARTDLYTNIRFISNESAPTFDVPKAEDHTIFDYRNSRCTAVTNYTGITHVYSFDEGGRLMLEYEDILPSSSEDTARVAGTVMYGYTDHRRTFSASNLAGGAGAKNFIVNGSFEMMNTEDGTPEGFFVTGHNPDNFISSSMFMDGGKSYVFEGFDREKYLRQTVEITNNPSATYTGNVIKYGDTLMLSAWANLLTGLSSMSPFAKFELRADINYSDSTKETVSSYFDPTYSGWQLAALPIRPNKNKTMTSVDVYLDCSGMSVNVYFDNVKLVNTLANDVTYEENNDSSSLSYKTPLYNISIFGASEEVYQKVTSHNGIMTTVSENNEMHLPLKVTTTDLDGNSFVSVFKYDTNGNLVASQDYRGTVTQSEYNSKGQTTKTISYHSDNFNTAAALVCPAVRFIKEFTYDEQGHFITSEKDPRGGNIDTDYVYDETTGLLTSVTDAGGLTTNYTYDSITNALTSVSANVDGVTHSVGYGYNNRMLTKITHNGFDYTFEYDGFGRQTKVSAADNVLSSTQRNVSLIADEACVTTETTYPTNEMITVITDSHNQPIRKIYSKDTVDTTLIKNEYDSMGKISKTIDYVTNTEYNYTYDELGNVTNEYRNTTNFKDVEYDSKGRLTKTDVHTNGGTLTYRPVYETREDGAIFADSALKGMILDNVFEETVTKDKYQRPEEKTLKVGNADLLGTKYEYLQVGNNLTSIVDFVTRKVSGVNKDRLHYTYDNNGNITTIEFNDYVNNRSDVLATYTYDKLNRLTRENNFDLNETYVYTYDVGGNILSKTTYTAILGPLTGFTPKSTKYYTYETSGWKDKLVYFGNSSTPAANNITYDSIGNPLTYLGHNLVWDRVRLLKQYDSLTFDYNASGIRTRKGTTTYELDGTNILSETGSGYTLRYYYDGAELVGFNFNNQDYFYEKNLQGDITGIYNTSGTLVGSYSYDAWGKCRVNFDSTGAAFVNPFRYRGYYYDRETSLYYLNSRYYDPSTGRFINADEVVSTTQGILGINLFIYCLDTPTAVNINNYSTSHTISIIKVSKFEIHIAPTSDIIIYYDVPLYDQNGYKLCWAFCQIMVEDYKKKRKKSNEQATARAIDLSVSIKGANWNEGGWPTNSSAPFWESNRSSPPTLIELFYILQDSGPVYAYYAGTSGAHLVVITGVNLTDGIIYTNNPWGIAGEQTYEEFLKGFVGMPEYYDITFQFVIHPDL